MGTNANRNYIVVYEDDVDGILSVMGADPDCEGAICCGRPVLLFGSRGLARTAIRISTAFARLRKVQGKIYNSDFLEDVRHVRIVPVAEYAVALAER